MQKSLVVCLSFVVSMALNACGNSGSKTNPGTGQKVMPPNYQVVLRKIVRRATEQLAAEHLREVFKATREQSPLTRRPFVTAKVACRLFPRHLTQTKISMLITRI